MADAARDQVGGLRNDLNNQQLADAIAAEAHDTLAHSLSLMALNASALQAQSLKLQESAAQLGSNANTDDFIEQIDSIRRRTQDIRKQAAGDKLCMGRVQMARLVERADLPPLP
ncbi:hypothetical protein [Bifidobacterium angulatum]|uniref:hypothetical protein n=1 Tax=Bifidobacterium angulatum TaxID=1683 RepID=UPI003AB7B5CF